MNWGHKITLVIVIFIVSMLGLVYYSFQQNVDMIDDNYYEKELRYQKIIDGKNNLDALQPLSLLSQDSTQLRLQLPKALTSSTGTLELIKNDDPKKDRTLPIHTDTAGIMLVPKSNLSLGWYTARIQCLADAKEYYREEKINITP